MWVWFQNLLLSYESELVFSQLNGYLLPTLQAVVLHGVVFYLFLGSWSANSDSDYTPLPVIIKATVLTMEDPVVARRKKESEARLKADAKSKQEAKRKADLEKEQQLKRAAAEKKKAVKKRAEAKRIADEKRFLKEQKRLAEQRSKDAQKEREKVERERTRKREWELAKVLDAEADFRQGESNTEAVQSYMGLIQQRVIENWHRPLSARNGMQALLQVNLVPTGEVSNVSLVKSSGDDAFDRSAIQAVNRVDKIEELQSLSPSIFDANFRQFRMLFKPEDLDR